MPLPATPSANKNDEASVSPELDHHLVSFWEKNGRTLTYVCVVVLAAILVRGIWQYAVHQREMSTEKAYADASTEAQLKAFAAAHPEHDLAGVALLRAADDAYAAERPGEAQAGYEKAADILKTGPLAARARLGAAMSGIQAGQGASAQAALKKLADDPQGYTAVRSEACYHLATLAAEAHNAADLRKYATQLMQIDPSGPWTQRAMALEATQPPPEPAAAQVLAPPPSIALPHAASK
jgi:predicted negative regulator of RcsB-dependent stress response